MATTSFSMRVSMALALAAPLALMSGVSPVHAQAAGLSQTVTISFAGTVGADPASTIQIAQPNGTFTPYSGPMPKDFPYQAGDQVKISFQATVPTAAYFQQQAAQGAAVPTDGVYHLQVASSNGNVNSPYVIGGASPATITGNGAGQGLVSVGSFGEPNSTMLSLTYNAKTGAYALDGTGKFGDSVVSGPGFTYDPATGAASTCAARSCSSAPQNSADYGLVATSANTITTFASWVYDAAGNIVGKFALTFDGLWTMNGTPLSGSGSSSGGGGATQVPEPGMAGLFGLASLALVLRGRRRV